MMYAQLKLYPFIQNLLTRIYNLWENSLFYQGRALGS